MKARAKGAKRILEVQKHLHDIAESKYLQIKQKLDACEQDERELANALSDEGALHGLFIDVTVKRLAAVRQEARRIEGVLQQCARAVLEQGGRVRNAKRLVESLEVEVRRVDERGDLEAMLEVQLAREGASLKQDG